MLEYRRHLAQYFVLTGLAAGVAGPATVLAIIIGGIYPSASRSITANWKPPTPTGSA